MLVYQKMVKGKYPSWPSDTKSLECGLTDDLWDLIQSCWSLSPQNRPKATYITRSQPHMKDCPTDEYNQSRKRDDKEEDTPIFVPDPSNFHSKVPLTNVRVRK